MKCLLQISALDVRYSGKGLEPPATPNIAPKYRLEGGDMPFDITIFGWVSQIDSTAGIFIFIKFQMQNDTGRYLL